MACLNLKLVVSFPFRWPIERDNVPDQHEEPLGLTPLNGLPLKADQWKILNYFPTDAA